MRDYIEIEESDMDIEDLEVDRDMQWAAVDAIRRARRCGTYYVIWEDEQIKLIPGDTSAPDEELLLSTADRLNRRIEYLRSLQPGDAPQDAPSPRN